MIVILCLDDNNGMMFNQRRQSRDRILCERILVRTCSSTLWMNNYSLKLFSDKNEHIHVADDFLEQADMGEFCFVENVDITPYKSAIEQVILYKWNRNYPDDFYFIFPLSEEEWHLQERNEFEGFSHEKITEEIYVRKQNSASGERILQKQIGE